MVNILQCDITANNKSILITKAKRKLHTDVCQQLIEMACICMWLTFQWSESERWKEKNEFTLFHRYTNNDISVVYNTNVECYLPSFWGKLDSLRIACKTELAQSPPPWTKRSTWSKWTFWCLARANWHSWRRDKGPKKKRKEKKKWLIMLVPVS